MEGLTNNQSPEQEIFAFKESQNSAHEPLEQLKELHLSENAFEDFLDRASKTPTLKAEEEVELAQQIEAGLFAESLLSIPRKRRSINANDEELMWLVEEGARAKEHMILANIKLVVSFAKRYMHPGATIDDLTQIGLIGLFDAVEHFDHTKGFKFSTYAAWWIEKELKAHAKNVGRNIQLPRQTIIEVMGYIKAQRKLEAANQSFDEEAIAKELEKPVERIREVARWAINTASIDHRLNDGSEETIGDILVDPFFIGPELRAEHNEFVEKLEKITACLEKEEAQMLVMLHGLDGNEPVSVAEASRRMDITQYVGQRIRRDMLRKLTSLMGDHSGYFEEVWAS